MVVTDVCINRLRIAVLLALALACGVLAPAARADHDQVSIIEDDLLLQQNLPGTLHEMQALGATEVRFTLHWSSVAPDPGSARKPRFDANDPAAYPAGSWTFPDELVQQAQADGLTVEFQLSAGAPRWAEPSGEPQPGPPGVWKPNPAEYGEFVRAVGTRYSGHYTPEGATHPLPKVTHWGFWNEPNFGESLAPQATDDDALELSPPFYRRLLRNGWAALVATGHRHDTILYGETAPHGHKHPIGNFDGIAPLRWIRVLYCLTSDYRHMTGLRARQRGCPTTLAARRRFRAENPGLFDASGFAIHPYASNVPPDDSQPGSVYNAADIGALPKLEVALDRVYEAWGSRRQVPIYNTEYGYQISLRISAVEAATYINWAEYISYNDPRVKSYAQYLLNDPAPGNFETGLFDAAGRPKPGANAYRLPLFMPVTRTVGARTLEVWGGVRPAAYAEMGTGLPQTAQIEFRPRGSGSFYTLALTPVLDPRGYFDAYLHFDRSGTVRTVWTDPMGMTYHSRDITVNVR